MLTLRSWKEEERCGQCGGGVRGGIDGGGDVRRGGLNDDQIILFIRFE